MIIKETNDAYDARRRGDWTSPSDVKGLNVPMDFIVNRKKPIVKKTHFDVGHAFHTSILEPEQFASEVTYALEADFPDQEKKNMDGSCRMSPKNKEKLAEIQANHPKKVVLREWDWNNITNMVLSFQGHYGASRMLNIKNGLAEHSFYCRYVFKRNGDIDRVEGCPSDAKRDSKLIMLVRTKADYVHKKNGFAMDLKSALSVAPKKFSKSAADLEYDIQGAMVLDLVSANMGERYETFIFTAIEKVYPWYVAMYDLDFSDQQDARNKYIKRLNVIRKAKNDGKFAGYEYLADNEWGLLPLEFPAWYKHQQQTSKF